MEGAPDAPALLVPDESFPPYRFVPGHTPHPFAQPGGYAFGERPEDPPYLPRDRWRENRAYLRGFDFFNRGWWWEAHEVWEGLWHSTEGNDDAQHDLLKGLIQLAASALNRERGHDRGARDLLATATARLESARDAGAVDGVFCGLVLDDVVARATAALSEPTERVDGFYVVPT